VVIEMINGRKVGVSRMGAGKPMLMLHPALAHRGALAPLMARLSGYAFTAFDLPGHGESAYDQSIDIQAQAVETAETLLAASGPSDVFGHSFGATVALKLALKRPDLVRNLYLYEPVYFSLLAADNPAAYAAEAKDSAAFTAAASHGDWPAAARAFLARWSMEGYDALPKPQQAYILRTIPLIMESGAAIIAPESAGEVLAGLTGLKLPVLLIRGAQSPQVIKAICAVIAARSNMVTPVVLPEAGHMGPITHAAAVAKAMTTSNT